MKKVLGFVKKLMASISAFLVGLSTKVFALEPQPVYGVQKPHWYDGIDDVWQGIVKMEVGRILIFLPIILLILLIGIVVYTKKRGISKNNKKLKVLLTILIILTIIILLIYYLLYYI